MTSFSQLSARHGAQYIFAVATQADVRRIALSLPDTEEAKTGFAFTVQIKGKPKGFIWVWMERVTPKKPRVANAGVLAVRVPNLAAKDLLISAEPDKFFTEPHYNGFPGISGGARAACGGDRRRSSSAHRRRARYSRAESVSKDAEAKALSR